MSILKRCYRQRTIVTLQNRILCSSSVMLKNLIAAFLNEWLIFLLMALKNVCIRSGGIQTLIKNKWNSPYCKKQYDPNWHKFPATPREPRELYNEIWILQTVIHFFSLLCFFSLWREFISNYVMLFRATTVMLGNASYVLSLQMSNRSYSYSSLLLAAEGLLSVLSIPA